MSTNRHIDIICVAAAIAALVLTVLFMNGEALGIAILTDEDAAADGMFTRNDQNADWDTSGATTIFLADEGARITGNGAYFANGVLHIVYAGKYILSGELTDGSVLIDADGDDKIWLLLNGVSLHCEDGAALRVEQADKVFLTLAEDTENTVTSGAEYREDLVSSGVDGAIYSRDDLTINGGGSLTVTGEYKHGIVCNDDLVITGGCIRVDAAQDGIHANDSVRIANADLTISAGDDGITVSNEEETGFLYIASGHISIPSCYEGLEAISVTIDGGTIDIAPLDDGINAKGDGTASLIQINGGNITVINPDGRDADGLDSNGDIQINGGEVFISVAGSGGSSAIDYGSENGGVCMISGGTVIACGGSAMAEGFAADSPQAFCMETVTAPAGAALLLTDAEGRTLLSGVIPCDFSSVLLSAPELQLGDACTLTVGDVQKQVTIDNTPAVAAFAPGGMPGGRPGQAGPDGAQPLPQQAGDQPEGSPPGGRPGQTGPDGVQPIPPETGDRLEDGRPGEPLGGMRPPGQTGEGDTAPTLEAAKIAPGSLLLVGLSVLVLLAGLGIALRYRD